jgi:PAS domain S-box-containing protein
MTNLIGESAGERRFRLVVEAAPNAIVMIDRTGKIAMVNTQAERVFGYSRAELVGRPVDMLVPERFRHHHPEMREVFFADPQPRAMGAGRDLNGLKKDGNEFPIEIGLNPIETDDGTMVLSTIVDITERKTAELALRESERRYSVLVDGVTDYAIYMIDPKGIVTNWNRGAQRIKGYRAEEIVGQHYACFYTEGDRAANGPQQALETAARDGRYEAVALRVRKDGSRFWADVVIDALKDDDGRLIGYAKITRDITERVHAIRELEEARTALAQSQKLEAIRQVVDLIPALVWSSLPDGSVDFVNRRWLDFTGLSSEVALGWGFTAAVHPEDLEHWRAARAARFAAGEPFEDESRLRRADGEYRYFLNRTAPMRDELGKVVKWYGSSTDIEDRKRAIEELHQARAELARVTRVTTLGALTAAIAHEVNQPLTGLVTNGNACLRWLAGETPDLEAARRAVERMIRDGGRAAEVISRISAMITKSPPQRNLLNINDPIREVIELTRSELQRNLISLQTELSNDVPLVLGDRIQLQQVILNLIMNAIEAMSGVGQVHRELLIGSMKEGSNGVLVAVRDSGPGLDSTAFDRLFDAFYTSKPNGMGMGLAISRTIVEAHGGQLWATPNVRQGAIFEFRLPRAGNQSEDRGDDRSRSSG